VTSTGAINTAGAASLGIRANSAAGAATVDVNNLATTGTTNGISVNAGTTSLVTVRGLVTAADGATINADGGAATIVTTASGTIRGRIDVTGNDDIVNNGGTFDAIGSSLFGAGADAVNNSGTVRSVNGAAVFSGLETFNNTGRVDLRDNAVGDTLNVTGAFVGGTNSHLGVDVNLSTNTADVLITGAATGSTVLDVNLLVPPIFNSTGTLVVDAAAGTSATAFTLTGGTALNNPFVRVNLLFDAPNNNFLLISLPDQPVFETVAQAEMLTNYWYHSADAISAQLEAARDGLTPIGTVRTNNLAGGGRFGGWVQAVAGNEGRDASQSFTGGGGTTVFNTSYDQDYQGVQGGLDYQTGSTILGISFGYGKSDADFDVSFNRVRMDGYNVGAYVAYHSNGFFLNAIAKIDWVNVDSAPGGGLRAEFDASAWGLRAAAGYRFHSGNVFIEPSVSLSYVNVDIDDYTVGGASVAFDNIESFRGAAGVRLGGEFRSGNGMFSPFVGVYAVDEFSGDNSATFTLGQLVGIAQDSPGTSGQLTGGLNYSTGQFEVFARGEWDFVGDRDGISGRAGVRLRF
jgi:uncharacterized protein with beta-barrel porin domain